MAKEVNCGHGSVHAAAMRDGKSICIPCFHGNGTGNKQKEKVLELDLYTTSITYCGMDKFGNKYGKMGVLKEYDEDVSILKYSDPDRARYSYHLMNVCKSKYVVRTWILVPNESEVIIDRIPKTVMSYFKSMLVRWQKGKNNISWYNYIKNVFTSFIRNILKGVLYMHEKKICHGNIGNGIAIMDSGRAKLYNMTNNCSFNNFELRRREDFKQLQKVMQAILLLQHTEGHRPSSFLYDIPREVEEFAFFEQIFDKTDGREWQWKWLFNHSAVMHPKNKILFVEKMYHIFRRRIIKPLDIDIKFSHDFKNWQHFVTQNCKDPIITTILKTGHYSECYDLFPFLRNVFVHYNEQDERRILTLYKTNEAKTKRKWTTPAAIVEKLEKIFPRLWEELREITKKILLDRTQKGETRDYLKQYFLNSNDQQHANMATISAMVATISDMTKTMSSCDEEHCNSVPLIDCQHSCLKCYDEKGKNSSTRFDNGDMSILKYKEFERARNSYNVLKLCEHEHVIRVWGFETGGIVIFTDRISCTVVSYFEWMSKKWKINRDGSWFNYIQEEFKKVFRDVIKGLRYMYKRGFFHGNIANGIAITDVGKIKLFNVVIASGTNLDSGRRLDFKNLQHLMGTIINLQYDESDRKNKELKDVEAPTDISKFLELTPKIHTNEDREWKWDWILDTSSLMGPEQKILIIEKLWTVVFQWKLVSPYDIDANLVNLKSWHKIATTCKDCRIKEMIESPKAGVVSYTDPGGFIRLLRNVVEHYNENSGKMNKASFVTNGEPPKHTSRDEIVLKLEETFEGLWEELRSVIQNILEDQSLKYSEMKRLKKYFLSSYKNEKTLPGG